MGTGAALLVIVAIGFAAMHANPASLDFYWVEMMQLYFAACSIVGVRTAMLLNERDLHAALLLRKHQSAVRGSHFKSQLLAHVSHEVRSPLSAIIGFSSMLESGSLTADRAPEFAAIIAHNGELLLRLHDALLDLSRAKAGALDIQSERVAVGDTLKNCVSAIRLDARLRGKNVLVQTVADSLALTCDPVRHRGGAQRAGRGTGPVHRQDAGRGAGRTDRFREGPRSPDPLLDLPAAGSLTGPRPHLIALPLRLGTGA
jgi:signal transduction histidine kinase